MKGKHQLSRKKHKAFRENVNHSGKDIYYPEKNISHPGKTCIIQKNINHSGKHKLSKKT